MVSQESRDDVTGEQRRCHRRAEMVSQLLLLSSSVS